MQIIVCFDIPGVQRRVSECDRQSGDGGHRRNTSSQLNRLHIVLRLPVHIQGAVRM